MQPSLFENDEPPALPVVPQRPTVTTVPYGKYKGQPLDVLLRDVEYAIWLLTSQYSKLQRAYPDLFRWLVMNYGPSQSTPQHNRLQNRFLNADFCLQFALALYPDLARQIKQAVSPEGMRAGWRSILPKRIAQAYSYHHYPTSPVSGESPAQQHSDFKARVLKTLQDDVSRIVISCERARGEIPKHCDYATEMPATVAGRVWEPPLEVQGVAFEVEGADVQFRLAGSLVCHIKGYESPAGIHSNGPTYQLAWCHVPQRSLRVEVKPFVGDDYTVILRAMVARQCNVLLVETFEADGASWEEMKQVFATRKIDVLLLGDVLLQQVPDCVRSLALPTIDPTAYIADAKAALDKFDAEWLLKHRE